MRKLGMIMLMIGTSIISFYFLYIKVMNNNEKKAVENYIIDTSEVIEKEDINVEINNKEDVNKTIGKKIEYKAVLEIPSINLKKGVVDSTKNFNSINYAISVDKHSSYPDKYGNFILYAHSGTSRISFFRDLVKVNINDEVYVYYNGVKYKYSIIDKYDIKKSGKAKVLGSNNNNYITLITCNQSKKGYQIVLTGILKDKSSY